jgi:transposase-like protein
MVETGRRRRWSEDEKLKIVLESLPGGATGATILNRSPAPPPFSSMNSTAAASKSRWMASP